MTNALCDLSMSFFDEVAKIASFFNKVRVAALFYGISGSIHALLVISSM